MPIRTFPRLGAMPFNIGILTEFQSFSTQSLISCSVVFSRFSFGSWRRWGTLSWVWCSFFWVYLRVYLLSPGSHTDLKTSSRSLSSESPILVRAMLRLQANGRSLSGTKHLTPASGDCRALHVFFASAGFSFIVRCFY